MTPPIREMPDLNLPPLPPGTELKTGIALNPVFHLPADLDFEEA